MAACKVLTVYAGSSEQLKQILHIVTLMQPISLTYMIAMHMRIQTIIMVLPSIDFPNRHLGVIIHQWTTTTTDLGQTSVT